MNLREHMRRMRVVVAQPPMIAEIRAAFNLDGRSVVFAWGDKIYNPSGIAIPPEIIIHETVHGYRQGDNVEQWWRRYIDDPEFRLNEEIPAHIAEFGALCGSSRERWTSERNMRRTIAAHVARKLASPLYGRLITFENAKSILLDEARSPQRAA